MKLTKTASGKNKIKISKNEWKTIGKKAGWMKVALGPTMPTIDVQKINSFDELSQVCGNTLWDDLTDPKLAKTYLDQGAFYLIKIGGQAFSLNHSASPEIFYDKHDSLISENKIIDLFKNAISEFEGE